MVLPTHFDEASDAPEKHLSLEGVKISFYNSIILGMKKGKKEYRYFLSYTACQNNQTTKSTATFLEQYLFTKMTIIILISFIFDGSLFI